jgi:hypothetical protein
MEPLLEPLWGAVREARANPCPLGAGEWVLYPVAAVNLALAAWFLWRVLVLARAVMLQYYPRWLI